MRKAAQTLIPERLVAARKERGWSQAELASRVEMTQQAINAIESGAVKRPTKLHDIAGALGVDVAYLLGAQDDPTGGMAMSNEPREPIAQIPDLAIFAGMGGGGLLDVTVDGDGYPTDPDQIRGYWSFPDYMVRSFRNLSKIYAWEARGDSMEPTIHGGSVVFIDTSQNWLPQNDICAVEYGDGLVLKRIQLVPRSDKVLIISENDRYRAFELLREEVTVWGTMVGWFQWRR